MIAKIRAATRGAKPSELQVGFPTRFDLVVTDIEMPEMDGFGLAEAMRHLPAASELPIIALSAMVSNEAIERGRAVGFHDFVAKFDRTGLIAAIKEQEPAIEQAA